MKQKYTREERKANRENYINNLYVDEVLQRVGTKNTYTWEEACKQFVEGYKLGASRYIKEFYTLDQLSEELDFNIRTLREFIKTGKLKAHKVGTRYICTREEIKDFIEGSESN